MGRAWKYGANIDTDQLAPVDAYMRPDPDEGRFQCLRALDPDFARAVQQGDVFVATDNLGIGSSREYAPLFLKLLGIEAVLAKSFARIFYRNCFNLGLPALVLPESDDIEMGDALAIDLTTGRISNETRGKTYQTHPLPDHLMEMVRNGGLMGHLKKRFAKA